MGWLAGHPFFVAENRERMLRRLAVGLFLTAWLSAQTPSPESLLRHATELQQAGDLEGAEQGYRDFLALRPNEVAVRSNLGVLLSRLGRYDQAVVEYKKALQLEPQNAGIVLNLGLAYYKAGQISAAAEAFSKARQITPDNLQVTLLLADCQLRLGHNRSVIQLLQPAEQQNADNPAIAYMLGMALIRDGQVQEGQKRVDQILRNGDSAESRFLLGTQMFAAGDFPAAVKQFASAIERNPSLPGLQAFYGQALLNTGDPDAAADAFRKELASDPNHFEANLYLAQILIARREWSEADPLVRQSLRVRPDSLEARLELADAEVGEGKLPEARMELEAARKSWPQSVAVHRRLSEVYAALDRNADAAREQKLAAGLEPKRRSAPAGPGAGDSAPEFDAARMGSGESVTLAELRGAGPVLLVFGSYTCPNFRSAAGTLNRLYPEYKNQIPFYLIYIREAHSTADWSSTRNAREGVVLEPPTSMSEKQDHATLCVRKLGIAFPALLDSMNGAAEAAYAAWPSKAFLLDRRGRIVFSTGLSEQDFSPEQLETALRQVSASREQSRLPGRHQ
jgi:tetratricopeptide (TPR) repeat protein